MFDPVIDVRLANADDLDFIVHSFLFSYWGAPAVRGMTRDDYFGVMRPRLKTALGHSRTIVTVACATDEPDVIAGWAATNGNTILWVYVKKAMRGMGIASSLVRHAAPTSYALQSQHISVPSRYAYRPDALWDLWRTE